MEGEGWGLEGCPCAWGQGRNPAAGAGAGETEPRFQKVGAQGQDGRGRLTRSKEGRKWVRKSSSGCAGRQHTAHRLMGGGGSIPASMPRLGDLRPGKGQGGS